MRDRPSRTRDTVLLVPLGKSFRSAVGAQFLEHLQAFASAFFHGMRVAVVPEALSLKAVKRRENDYGHPQYLISDLFHMLNTDKAVVRFREQYCILGVRSAAVWGG